MIHQVICGLLILTSLALLSMVGKLDLLVIVLPLALLLTLGITRVPGKPPDGSKRKGVA